MNIKYFLVFFMFIIISCSVPEDIPPLYMEPDCTYTEYEISCISSLNFVREENGLNCLILSNGLSILAQEHAEYLAINKTLTHLNYGVRLSIATNVMGYYTLSENTAYGYYSLGGLISAWLKSDSHRHILLDSRYTHHGIGIGIDDVGRYYYVHLLAYK